MNKGEAFMTPTQTRVLERLGTYGESNKEIANALGMTEATVKVHLRSVMKEAKVRNRSQLVIWAISRGLVIDPMDVAWECEPDMVNCLGKAVAAEAEVDRIAATIGRHIISDPTLLSNPDYHRFTA